MDNKNTKRGRVVTPADANPWPHEQKVAKILALAGHYVEFIPETNLKTPDIYLDSTIYEIKSPITNNPKKVVRNVKRALEKSPNVIIDSSRVKGLNDEAIQRTLKNKVKDLPGLKNLLFINKRGQIIDIIALVWYNKSIEVLARGVMLLPQELLFIVFEPSSSILFFVEC